MAAVLAQAYFGSRGNLSDSKMAQIRNLFGDQDVVTKGLLSDLMYGNTSSKATAQRLLNPDEWNETSSFDFVNEAGWYFKTLAAQEPGEDSVLFATYGRRYKNVSTSTHLLPFFGTDYGLCRYVCLIIGLIDQDLRAESSINWFRKTIFPKLISQI